MASAPLTTAMARGGTIGLNRAPPGSSQPRMDYVHGGSPMKTSLRRTLGAALGAGILAIGMSLALPTPRALADEPAKNLKILPKTMSRGDIKKLMKSVASALGVQCDHC